TVFNAPASYSAFTLIIGAVGLSFQLYCNFSGYADIACGIAKLLGFEVPVNFRFPYFAVNPAAFWRRWHISLSCWLKDYVYIPLGGSEKGFLRTILNILVVFALGSLWYGADANVMAAGL